MENTFIIPKGWFAIGAAPQKYDIGLDPSLTYKGRPCVTIKARPDSTDFGSLAQSFKADQYRGKRLRFSAALRTVDALSANLWMRVDGPGGKMLAFDNMQQRPVTGTTDWAHHAIVLDVVEEAYEIYFGVFLEQRGQVWMADVQLEEVGTDVPTTDIQVEATSLTPVNLGFDE